MWSEWSLHIYRKISDRIGFNVSNIIFGEIPLTFDTKAINFIILYTKQYISTCLMQNKEPNFIALLCHLKFKYRVEKYAAIQKFRIRDFDKIWMKWEAIFEI